ncbi:MAG: HlyD family efflux transporter periplasmic adaptor subunit [Xanthobacteraceae bacterium]
MTAPGSGPEPLAPSPSVSDGRGPVAFLDQALWRDLVSADAAEAFGAAWLALACRIIAGAAGGVLLLTKDSAAPELVATWPAGALADPGLLASGRHAIKDGRGVVQPPSSAQPVLRVAYPVQLDGAIAGAVALDVESSGARDPREAMRQLQWAVAWVRDFLRRRAAAAGHGVAERTALALDLIAAALEEDTASSACRVAATELAIKLGCERVSFGFLTRGECRVAGISHSAQFGKRMNLVRQLADAMDEAVDQQAIVLYPPTADEHLLVRAHAALAAGHGSAFILTVPMFVKDHFVGAVTFERASGQPFDQQTIDIADAVASILGPALHDKRLNDRSIFIKCGDALAAQARHLLGPGYYGRKLAVIAAAAVVLFFYFATGPYRISADGQVEGEIRRSIVAPFDGFVGEAPARAGDLVRRGDLLAALDDRDLVLERLRWVTERQQHTYQYDQALSKQERADALKFQSLLGQADAQIRLVDEQLARSRLLAPFDGLVASGDLTKSIGAAVRRGDVLFEVAPLSNYLVELHVNESQIADVAIGQHGDLIVSALPDQVFPFVVNRITPVATAKEGSTFFAVEGRITTASERLRPGMEGVGKIDVDDRRLIWIWSRSVLHWLQIASWKWIP